MKEKKAKQKQPREEIAKTCKNKEQASCVYVMLSSERSYLLSSGRISCKLISHDSARVIDVVGVGQLL